MAHHAISQTSTERLGPTVCIAVVFTLAVAVAFGFGLYLFALVVTSMRADLGFDYASIGMVTGGAQLSYLAAALLCPRLVDRFGGAVVILSAEFVSAGLLGLFSVVETVAHMALVLAGLGAAAALTIVPTVGVISRVVPFAYRSRVNGLVSSGTAYGQFANGIAVPLLMPEHGWRAVWLAVSIVSLCIAGVGVLALRIFARDALHRHPARETEQERSSDATHKLVTARNVIVWSLFALSGMACGPWQNYMASFLADERKWPLSTVGQIWSLVGIVGLFSGFAAGLAADRLGIRTVLIIFYAILSGSALLIALGDNAWSLRAAGVCFGLSFYAAYGLVPAYISKTVDARSAIVVFAIANVFLGAGTTLGNVVGGYAPVLFGTLQSVFLAASATAIVAMGVTALLPSERHSATRLAG